MSKLNKEIFKQIVLVNVTLSVWSGFKRNSDEDLIKMNAALPDGGIITKGGKKIFPSEPLKAFSTLDKAISRKLAKIGVSALGGSSRVIPSTQVKEISKFIDECEKEFKSLLVDFESNYDAHMEDYLEKEVTDPVVHDIIERSKLHKDEAVKRFKFAKDIFSIMPKGDGEGLVSNLVTKLFDEVSAAASDALDKSFLGKPRVGQRALNQVVAIRNKMAGLSMLDGKSIQPIINTMDDVLNSMPADGWIEGLNYSALIGLVSMLCDPDDMLKHAEKIQQGIASSIPTQGMAASAQVNVVAAPVVFGDLFSDQVQVAEPETVATVIESTAEKLPAQPLLTLVTDVVTASDVDEANRGENILPIVPAANMVPAKKVAAFF